MVHTFDTKIASEYSVNAAIILQNIYYWIKKNEANDKHFYDGYYWTYNSVKAFEEMFPYMSKKQITTALTKLEEAGIIICGNYNSSAYDRTKWYALTEDGYELIEKGKSIVPKGEMDCSEMSNRFASEGKPIPYINTYNKPNNNTVSNDTVCQTAAVQRCVDAWNSLSDCGIKSISKMTSSSKRYQSLVARIKEYGVEDVLAAIDKIRDSKFLQGRTGSKRAWVITFDWFVLPNNFPKVLEGNYDDEKDPVESQHTETGGWQ